MFIVLNAAGDTIFEALLVDAAFSRAATSTSNPVELGSDTSDHVQPREELVRIRLGVSDTGLAGPTPGLSGQVYDFLDELERNPQLVDILTTMRTFRSMVLVNLGTRVDTGSGTGLIIETSWKEQVTTQAVTVGVPASILAAAVRAGGKGRTKPPAAPRPTTKKEKASATRSLAKGLKTAILNAAK